MPLNSSACEDPGLAMAFDHIIKYFTPEQTLRRLPAGTACPLCGSPRSALWKTGSGDIKCLAQLGIACKRARRGVDDPLEPRPGLSGMVAFSDGSMLVAGPHVARVVTKLYPVHPIPDDVTVIYPSKGAIRDELISLIRNPPEPPFVAIVFGQKAGFRAEITVDPSRIVVNGPDGHTVDRPYLLELVDLLKDTSQRERGEIFGLRARIALGVASRSDRDTLERLKTDHPEIVAAFRRLPSPGSSVVTALNRILNT